MLHMLWRSIPATLHVVNRHTLRRASHALLLWLEVTRRTTTTRRPVLIRIHMLLLLLHSAVAYSTLRHWRWTVHGLLSFDLISLI
jgi:hypothetical protein